MDQRGVGASTILSRGGGTDAVAAGPTLEAGAVVAGYVIESLAGAGGMGVVYRAADPELGRQVAVKLIAPQRAEDPRFRELFVRESLVAAGLEHPNVIPIYRAGEDEGRLYIAMRYVEGASLQDLIAERGRVPPGRAARVVARVADALDAAHARGLVHRDVKPANVLIADPDGEEHVYLTDFGLSAGMSVARDGAPSRWAGTLAYLAPEQIRGGPIDARTDVYALGCVLFHALAGRPPFATGDEAAALEAHLTQAPPRLAEAAPDLPPALDEVVRRAMAKRPEDRFETAGELGRAALAARYDVAILRAEGDAAAAREIAARLEEAGLQPLVQEGGEPAGRRRGRRRLERLRRPRRQGGPRRLGPGGPGRREGDRRARPRLPQGPGAAAGGPEPVDPSLAFLATNPWIDLRAGVADPHGIDDLVRVLRGAEVGPGLTAGAGRGLPVPGPRGLPGGGRGPLLRPRGGRLAPGRAAPRHALPGRPRRLRQRQELARRGRAWSRPCAAARSPGRVVARAQHGAGRAAPRRPRRQPAPPPRLGLPERRRPRRRRALPRPRGRPRGSRAAPPTTASSSWWTSSRRPSPSARTRASGRPSSAT